MQATTGNMSTIAPSDDLAAILEAEQADRALEERAYRAKEILSKHYATLAQNVQERKLREAKLESQIANFPELEKEKLRARFNAEEILLLKDNHRQFSRADFESLAVIGRGAFGEVRMVRRRPGKTHASNPPIFALKSLKKDFMLARNQVQHVMAERKFLAEVPNGMTSGFPALQICFQDDEYLHIVMDFIPGGDLMTLLMKHNTFSEETAKFFMAETAIAIAAVHALGYIHRDIKPDNILIDCRGHLKLADFGLCKKVGDISVTDYPECTLETLREKGVIVGSNENSIAAQVYCTSRSKKSPFQVISSNGQNNLPIEDKFPEGGALKPQRSRSKKERKKVFSTVGTPDYIAPEVLAAQNGKSGFHYDERCDWWPVGIVFYECLFGHTPFNSKDQETTCRKIIQWQKHFKLPWDARRKFTPSCIDFLSHLITAPESRIGSQKNSKEWYETGFIQVVKHPWFEGFDWQGLPYRNGPLLPCGSKEIPTSLEELKKCHKSDPQFKNLVKSVTRNFDNYEDTVSIFDESTNRTLPVIDRKSLGPFAGFEYKRSQVPTLPTYDACSEKVFQSGEV